jgi:hypothetical protein
MGFPHFVKGCAEEGYQRMYNSLKRIDNILSIHHINNMLIACCIFKSVHLNLNVSEYILNK